jgi:hypothetical protein
MLSIWAGPFLAQVCEVMAHQNAILTKSDDWSKEYHLVKPHAADWAIADFQTTLQQQVTGVTCSAAAVTAIGHLRRGSVVACRSSAGAIIVGTVDGFFLVRGAGAEETMFATLNVMTQVGERQFSSTSVSPVVCRASLLLDACAYSDSAGVYRILWPARLRMADGE